MSTVDSTPLVKESYVSAPELICPRWQVKRLLEDVQFQELKLQFELLDADRSGTLDTKELVKLTEWVLARFELGEENDGDAALGLEARNNLKYSIVHQILAHDTDRNGLQVTEFIELIQSFQCGQGTAVKLTEEDREKVDEIWKEVVEQLRMKDSVGKMAGMQKNKRSRKRWQTVRRANDDKMFDDNTLLSASRDILHSFDRHFQKVETKKEVEVEFRIGTICFAENGRSRPYLIVPASLNLAPSAVLQVLRLAFKLEKPQLVLDVKGGSKSSYLEWAEDCMKTKRTAQAWHWDNVEIQTPGAETLHANPQILRSPPPKLLENLTCDYATRLLAVVASVCAASVEANAWLLTKAGRKSKDQLIGEAIRLSELSNYTWIGTGVFENKIEQNRRVEVAQLFNQFDKDNSGGLDFTETVMLLKRLLQAAELPQYDMKTMRDKFNDIRKIQCRGECNKHAATADLVTF